MKNKPLRVLNTRPKAQAKATSEKLIKAGYIPIEYPLLTIEATPTDWLNTLPPRDKIQHAIFISPNAVHYFFEALPNQPWPMHIITYAIGAGTKKALEQYGVSHIICPEVSDSEHLLELPSLQVVKAHHILLAKGHGGRDYIETHLKKRGAILTPLALYTRVLPTQNPKQTTALFETNAFDIILITSETALNHLFILFGEEKRPWLLDKTCWTISPRLEAIARQAGFKHVSLKTI